MNFWDNEGHFQIEVDATYDYDADNYPEEASIITVYTAINSNIRELYSARQIYYTYK